MADGCVALSLHRLYVFCVCARAFVLCVRARALVGHRHSALFDGYRKLRDILDGPDFVGRTKPLLAGPDVALQRHSELADALAGRDTTIIDKLQWVDNFTRAVGSTLDVVSWHTYDFHAKDVGTQVWKCPAKQ